MSEKTTAHSEVGRLTSVLIKRPRDAYRSQDIIDKEWENLNYYEAPLFDPATLEFEFLEDILAKTGTEFHFLPDTDRVSMDSIYCRDASISTDFGMILCNMGKAERIPEPDCQKTYFTDHNISILGAIKSPGTLEGGDVTWLDSHTLAVGHTYRTNMNGISQLKSYLEPHNIRVVVAEMPHFKGPSDVFHLMSVLSPVDHKKALVYSPLLPIHFRELLLEMHYELIEVPDEEFDTMGCNVLAIEPSNCLMVSGNPITKSRLEAAGCQVMEYQGKEISLKGEGGPTCLTRPIKRAI